MNQRQHLWAPWRIDYLSAIVADEPRECFLCQSAALQPDSEEATQALLLHRDAHGLLLLNRYPYTNGHLLVAPHAHVSDLSDLPPAGRAGLMELVELGSRTLRRAVNPQGLNVGLNQGRAAGAGVPGHLHWHVVPRWAGDTNFMDAIGQTRVIPQALDASYKMLRQAVAAEVG